MWQLMNVLLRLTRDLFALFVQQPVGFTLDLEDYHPSLLLHCWLGHLTCKIIFEMTYNVSSGR